MNNKINIIIIGAKNYNKDYNKDNIFTYNNLKQADYNTLIILKDNLELKNYTVSITCFDGGYENNISDGPVKYINEHFVLGDINYLDKDAHNIFIEYCNLLDEYFVTKSNNEYNNQVENILNYNDFKISFLSCGCSWDLLFPYDLINIIIEKKYYTPTDVYNVDSFLTSIGINDKNEKNMIPYMQGIFQILGSLMWRGYTDDYTSENVLYDLLNILNIIEERYFKLTFEEKNELKKFINKKLHWNALSRNIRVSFTNFIYGKNIITSN